MLHVYHMVVFNATTERSTLLPRTFAPTRRMHGSMSSLPSSSTTRFVPRPPQTKPIKLLRIRPKNILCGLLTKHLAIFRASGRESSPFSSTCASFQAQTPFSSRRVLPSEPCLSMIASQPSTTWYLPSEGGRNRRLLIELTCWRTHSSRSRRGLPFAGPAAIWVAMLSSTPMSNSRKSRFFLKMRNDRDNNYTCFLELRPGMLRDEIGRMLRWEYGAKEGRCISRPAPSETCS